MTDQQWMQRAIELAKQAEERNEVPVGAIIVINNQIVGEGANQPIASCDSTAHAEIIALRQASKNIENYRLNDATVYVTLEPCLMCVGAMIHARVKRLVFGAHDAKAGAVCSAMKMIDHPKHNHFIQWESGVLEKESQLLLSEFFSKRRMI